MKVKMLKYLLKSVCALAIAALSVTVGCGTSLVPDTDQDGVADIADNCPTMANISQFDADLDGLGDVCDNCPNTSNADQEDQDGDGFGAACDSGDLNPFVN
jgi:hypothetical protein